MHNGDFGDLPNEKTLNELLEQGRSRDPHDDSNDVVLATLGIIVDGGLCVDGRHPECWRDHAAGAVADSLIHNDTLVALPEGVWGEEAARPVVGAVHAVGTLLHTIATYGPAFFFSLSDPEREELQDVVRRIETVVEAVRVRLDTDRA